MQFIFHFICMSLTFWNNSEIINRENQVLYVMYNTHPLSIRRELRFKDGFKDYQVYYHIALIHNSLMHFRDFHTHKFSRRRNVCLYLTFRRAHVFI